jgi:hypothetical protein
MVSAYLWVCLPTLLSQVMGRHETYEYHQVTVLYAASLYLCFVYWRYCYKLVNDFI